MPSTQITGHPEKPWSLADDIRAEFGAHRALSESTPRLTPSQISAVRLSFEFSSTNLPSIMRKPFLKNAVKKLESHFGLELEQIPAEQFHEVLQVANEFIADAKGRLSSLVLDFPEEDPRRWRLVSYDMTLVNNGDHA